MAVKCPVECPLLQTSCIKRYLHNNYYMLFSSGTRAKPLGCFKQSTTRYMAVKASDASDDNVFVNPKVITLHVHQNLYSASQCNFLCITLCICTPLWADMHSFLCIILWFVRDLTKFRPNKILLYRIFFCKFDELQKYFGYILLI